ncbi:spermidine synthase [Motilimonas pumila]|uniref:Spermidine synthase n=1 Tax=Motilimonas pumila TaxID=2303987 RepID=A0A418YKH9_9GAMM|nr:spermidine synthase [Motilimonas pumila]RJG51485.1 spermidine synthase [Motilimonas pumila]
MSNLNNAEKLLFIEQDEWGPVIVTEHCDTRYLSFGPGDEQSRQNKHHPALPEHEYIQAMCLILLLVKPKSALVLGLGAGCLVSALHHAIKGVRISAVELRPLVIEVAKRFFRLPSSKKITLIPQNANHFIAQKPDRKTDIIFADIYGFKGVDLYQLRPEFIDDCCMHLKEGGSLVLNCWLEHQTHTALLPFLRRKFSQVWQCELSSGNWVILATNTPFLGNKKHLKQQADALQQSTQIDLFRALNQLELVE